MTTALPLILAVICVGFVALVAAMHAVHWGDVPRFGPDPLKSVALPSAHRLSAATAPATSSPSVAGATSQEAA